MSDAYKFWYTLWIASFVFNYMETAYFGFNKVAMSFPETVCDRIGLVWIILAIIGMWRAA